MTAFESIEAKLKLDSESFRDGIEEARDSIEQLARGQAPAESPQMKHRREAWIDRARCYQRENGAEE